MLDFQIFRVKVFPSKQGHLFRKNIKPHELLKLVILSSPSSELRKGMIWHIGKLSEINETGVYFKFGRKAKYKMELYEDGDFVDQEIEGAYYSHVIIDIPLELVGISKKPKLMQRTARIANYLVKLLNEAELTKQYEANFEIAEINDPTDFITHLHQSLSINKFWITFSRPNVWDANKDFIKPSEKLLEESSAEKGKTIIEGDNLKPDSLEDLARSAASTGNDAAAWLQLSKDENKTKKSLKGNPVVFSYEDITDEKDKKKILNIMRKIYQQIRGNIN